MQTVQLSLSKLMFFPWPLFIGRAQSALTIGSTSSQEGEKGLLQFHAQSFGNVFQALIKLPRKKSQYQPQGNNLQVQAEDQHQEQDTHNRALDLTHPTCNLHRLVGRQDRAETGPPPLPRLVPPRIGRALVFGAPGAWRPHRESTPSPWCGRRARRTGTSSCQRR